MITVALISGALAERIKYSTWMIFVALWITLCYCPLAHMVWNGGLLSPDGAISQAIGASAHDFAGGTVVHINAAAAALIVVLIIGRRKGFGTQPMRPHNVPMVMLGAFLLWFGWFGFNTQRSTVLGVRGQRHRRIRLGEHRRSRGRGHAGLGLHREDPLRPLHRHGRGLGHCGRAWWPSPRPPTWSPRCGPWSSARSPASSAALPAA